MVDKSDGMGTDTKHDAQVTTFCNEHASELGSPSPMVSRTMTNPWATSSMRRVLVVAYVFPPSGGAGVQRITKFVKYLPEFGWDCSVLTVSNPSVPLRDESLVTDIPPRTIVRKAKTLEPSYALKNAVSATAISSAAQRSGWKSTVRRLVRAAGNAILQPDAQILWYPHAVRKGLQILDERSHDAIFVTAPPFSAFLIGAALSRASGLPLVIDYRDEWGITNRYQENRQKSSMSHVLQAQMQRAVLKQATTVIATTRRSADSLRELVAKSGSRAAVTQIYNGFDAADGFVSTARHADSTVHSRFRVVYVGTLWNLTSIAPIVAAFQRVCFEQPALAAQLELVVAGRRTAEQQALLDKLSGLPCQLTRMEYVEHRQAVDIMRSADAQCLLLSDVDEASRVMPAKTFEYLATGRPILSIGPVGEVSELLANCPYASHFVPSDVDGIARYLVDRLQGAREMGPSSRASTSWNVQQYERRQLTWQLAAVLGGAQERVR